MRPRLTWVGPAVIVACCGPALAACGGSSHANANRSSSTAVELSQCMRSHGVPSFPDPPAQGNIQLTGINPASPAFQSAQQACKQFAPFKTGPATMSESQKQEALRFAECMRANGQPDFPDPSLTPPPGTTRMLVLRGMVFAFSAGIDPKSPAFRQAAIRCGVTPPGDANTAES